MKNSCGFFIYHKKTNTILMGHATNTKDEWSIPKGGQEEGESLLQTALRELNEEANIPKSFIENATVFQLTPHNYSHKKKRLNAFLAISDELPKNIKCISYFEDSFGNKLPEFDNLYWFTLESLLKREIKFHDTQFECLLEVETILNNLKS